MSARQPPPITQSKKKPLQLSPTVLQQAGVFLNRDPRQDQPQPQQEQARKCSTEAATRPATRNPKFGKKKTQDAENKPDEATEAATISRRPNKIKTLLDQECVKMTSPVKIASTVRQSTSQISSPISKSLKTLNQGKLTKVAARTTLHHQKLFPSPRKPASIKPLISKWEELSTRNLTPAVAYKPKLREIVDSQSWEVLQNQAEKFPNKVSGL
jgi:hypothetical protein